VASARPRGYIDDLRHCGEECEPDAARDTAGRLHVAMASQSNEARERRDVHYAGLVQGVGFRYTTRAIAARFDVQGFVENLRDGRVHLVVEGTTATLDRFLSALESEMSRYIQHRDAATRAASGEFTRFEIRH
jgi:acylphosphatase